MTDYLVTVALIENEWRVVVDSNRGGQFSMSATEARDLSQRLYAFALEISERETPAPPPADSAEVRQLKVELERERAKRLELARRVAPKAMLEAAKAILRLELQRRDDPQTFYGVVTANDKAEVEAALAWLSEFKA